MSGDFQNPSTKLLQFRLKKFIKFCKRNLVAYTNMLTLHNLHQPQ
uniref:Uncharacterized protein n=1 Tax=Brassica campestris TaxID=3711 RepID=A0A3P5Z4E8_BRACM|nr:unnamed protein product [Brassica rapa]